MENIKKLRVDVKINLFTTIICVFVPLMLWGLFVMMVSESSIEQVYPEINLCLAGSFLFPAYIVFDIVFWIVIGILKAIRGISVKENLVISLIGILLAFGSFAVCAGSFLAAALF